MIDPEQLTFVQLFWLVFALVMLVFCFSWWLDSAWTWQPIR